MGAIADTVRTFSQNKKPNVEKLSILIGKDSFFYLLVDENKSITYFRKWIKTDKKIIFSNWVLNILSQDTRLRKIDPLKSQIGICSRQYTLIPVPLFEEPYKRLYLDRNTRSKMNLCYVDSVTTRQFIKVVYAVPPSVLKIKRYLGSECLIKHVMGGLIKYFYNNLGIHQGITGLVHLRNNQMFILLFEDGRLLFSNIYSFFSNEDFFYFISLVLSELKLKPAHIALYGSGDLYVETKKWNWLVNRFEKFKLIPGNKEIFGFRTTTSQKAYELLDLISII